MNRRHLKTLGLIGRMRCDSATAALHRAAALGWMQQVDQTTTQRSRITTTRLTSPDTSPGKTTTS